METKTLWMRTESHVYEQRTLITPNHAAAFIKAGYQFVVEESPDRVYTNEEYAAKGCVLAKAGSWEFAPKDAVIIGVKNLPEDTFPLHHRHLYTSHMLEGEVGSGKLLKRFDEGGGVLYALEELFDSTQGQIVARSAGRLSGAAGTYYALNVWAQKQIGKQPPFTGFAQKFETMESFFEAFVNIDFSPLRKEPSVLVIAPYGNVGRGARMVLDQLHIPYDGWTRVETADKEKRKEFTNYPIVINGMSTEHVAEGEVLPQFYSLEDARTLGTGKLSILADIALDMNDTLKISRKVTSHDNPTHRVENIDIVAVDNLGSLLPRIASDAFSLDFVPLLCQLLMFDEAGLKGTAWEYALNKFKNAPRI